MDYHQASPPVALVSARAVPTPDRNTAAALKHYLAQAAHKILRYWGPGYLKETMHLSPPGRPGWIPTYPLTRFPLLVWERL